MSQHTELVDNQTTVLVDNQMSMLIDLLAPYARVVPFEGRANTEPTIAALRQLIIQNNATALIVRSTTSVNSKLLHDTPVRFIASATAGVDHIDVEYVRNNNITFASAQGCNANAVADYVMLAIELWRASANCHWPAGYKPTLGIVGKGNVGSKLAMHASHSGKLEVRVYDPPLALAQGWHEGDHVRDLKELFAISDVVSLHVPLTRTGDHPTHGMVAAAELTALKPRSLFINTSRGHIVDEKVLKTRLETHELDAVLDVYDNEPSIDLDLMNTAFIATPHVAGYTIEAKNNTASFVGDAFLRWLGVGTFAFYEALARSTKHAPDYRDLHGDTTAMREQMNNAVETDSTFDLLRKSYLLRHEFFR